MKTQTLSTLIVFLLNVSLLCGSQAGQNDDAIPVCSALENVADFRGKVVTLTGWLKINWYHGVNFLSPSKDGSKCPGLQGDRSAWPSGVLVIWPKGRDPHDPVPFESEPDKIWKLLIKHVNLSEVGIEVRAVIEGHFQSREGLRITSSGEGMRPMGNGYGRLGGDAAQLVLKRIVKIEKPIEVY